MEWKMEERVCTKYNPVPHLQAPSYPQESFSPLLLPVQHRHKVFTHPRCEKLFKKGFIQSQNNQWHWPWIYLLKMTTAGSTISHTYLQSSHLWKLLGKHEIMWSNHKQLVNNSEQAEAKQSFCYRLYLQLKKWGWITHCYALVCHLLWYSTEQKSLLKNECILFRAPFSNDFTWFAGVGHGGNIDHGPCCLKYISLQTVL